MPAKSRRLLLILAIAAALPAGVSASGAIYGFVDESGVEHLTNIPNDSRYRLLLRDRLAPAAAALKVPRGVFALPTEQRPFDDAIRAVSRTTGVDAALLHAVIAVESGYRDTAVSARGATGLMQLMPATARRYGLENARDPAANIRAGARYLRDLLALFDNDIELALAGYNAGENAVLRHGWRIPPYAETQRYVPLVLAHYERLNGLARR
ncbi:lytic transglycosylase domain-containing protein [Dechloromonas sp. A34]|uniref:lytic transglycosylase domain-containing protein n=1 Tax=Dechloromonas sp. A34 TaxID=447588 RepID=UPI0022498D6B|nr:lytic transglycosylase domain-containing protein [Dechloromonas sp. A34]